MSLITYAHRDDFINANTRDLERREALHSLLLGIALRSKPEDIHCWSFKNRLYAIQTPPFNVLLAAPDDHDYQDLLAMVVAFAQKGVLLPGVTGEQKLVTDFAKAWTNYHYGHYLVAMEQCIYELTQVNTPVGVPGLLREARTEERPLVLRWGQAFYDQVMPGTTLSRIAATVAQSMGSRYMHVWEVDNRPVSIAALARPTRRGITINYVYTPPELRRRGYASALVAALSEKALRMGHEFCTLYTDASNRTSNKIYQNIGYQLVARSRQINFGKEALDHIPGGSG